MKHKGMTVYGIVSAALLTLANVAHAIWTVELILSHINDGGKGLAMGFIVVFTVITEAACVPILLAALLFFILHRYRRAARPVLLCNIALAALLTAQITAALFLMF